MKNTLLSAFIFIVLNSVMAQKKTMDPSVYESWNRITNSQISNNGDWVSYNLRPGQGDRTLVLYNTRTKVEKQFDRSENAQFDHANACIAFLIKPALDSIHEYERKNENPKEMLKDSLGLYFLNMDSLVTIPNVKSYKMPEKASGVLAYKFVKGPNKKLKSDTMTMDTIPKDSMRIKRKPEWKKRKKPKKETLVYFDYVKNKKDTIDFADQFLFPEESTSLLITNEDDDSLSQPGVFIFERSADSLKSIFKAQGKFKNITTDKKGEQVAFVADLDTTEVLTRPFELYYWNKDHSLINQIIYPESATLPDGWAVNEYYKIHFSDNGKRLLFGISPEPIEEDTLLIRDEIVDVEIWNYKDGYLYTQQETNEKRTKEQSYLGVFDTEKRSTVLLGNESIPYISLDKDEESIYALGYSNIEHLQHLSWKGYAENDLYRYNVETGEYKSIASKVAGRTRVSPLGNYYYWYSSPDTAWYSYSVIRDSIHQITNNDISVFYDEINDRPRDPSAYGAVGWTTDEKSILINDRYDIWEIDPEGKNTPRRITTGRSKNIEYKLVWLDPDEKCIDLTQKAILNTFNNIDKSSGYVYCDLQTGEITPILHGDYWVRRNIKKAKESDDIFFTRQSYQEYPDLIHTDLTFENQQKISNANPQQNEYDWGSIELFNWKDTDGIERTGLLVKPENFDPTKTYPLLVNFYEKSSNGLHRHREPYAHRSTITYTYYANQGYVIFNPDIYYKVGYPGKSCLDAVVSGVNALTDLGYIDKDRMGVQGHSWGGYQIAYLLNKTDIFACAESGAPVVNMVSAYGGIRWGSGMSRMFQYEKTQSRLGATLWERPDLYLENSPIFDVDKLNTPVLIMHNDEDGAVPWYQGIEYFTALRRLGKPSWMLNYRGEPHWPQKWQNRLDFNIRMQEFFDHYLMGKDMPVWMDKGSSPLEVISIKNR